jgi:hypothetical protein
LLEKQEVCGSYVNLSFASQMKPSSNKLLVTVHNMTKIKGNAQKLCLKLKMNSKYAKYSFVILCSQKCAGSEFLLILFSNLTNFSKLKQTALCIL